MNELAEAQSIMAYLLQLDDLSKLCFRILAYSQIYSIRHCQCFKLFDIQRL